MIKNKVQSKASFLEEYAQEIQKDLILIEKDINANKNRLLISGPIYLKKLQEVCLVLSYLNKDFLFNDIQLATKLEKKATKLFEQLDVAGREIRDTAVNYLKKYKWSDLRNIPSSNSLMTIEAYNSIIRDINALTNYLYIDDLNIEKQLKNYKRSFTDANQNSNINHLFYSYSNFDLTLQQIHCLNIMISYLSDLQYLNDVHNCLSELHDFINDNGTSKVITNNERYIISSILKLLKIKIQKKPNIN
ncbi:hypothetical protein [Bacillus anthracis]|uniref:Uncharacterized protein n=1 Tax=Bacillus anthracis TaxID=1392 RepID=A0A0J1KNY7_BACAN|nr:hypothetical protein [Bacillus anthracis]KLV18380.1 hypothetical protein ABW01_13460 [Bacillus anthracis]